MRRPREHTRSQPVQGPHRGQTIACASPAGCILFPAYATYGTPETSTPLDTVFFGVSSSLHKPTPWLTCSPFVLHGSGGCFHSFFHISPPYGRQHVRPTTRISRRPGGARRATSRPPARDAFRQRPHRSRAPLSQEEREGRACRGARDHVLAGRARDRRGGPPPWRNRCGDRRGRAPVLRPHGNGHVRAQLSHADERGTAARAALRVLRAPRRRCPLQR